MSRRLKLPLPPDPLGLFTGIEELELPLPDLPFPLPFPGEEIEEAEEAGELEEESEEDKVTLLLQAANRELRKGNIEGAYSHLDYAVRLSRCDRCIRNMKSIVQKIKSGDIPEARRRLTLLVQLIPAYYGVIRGEGELGVELNATKSIEEECNGCVASEIIELCQWDTACLDEVIAFIETQKAKGLKVMNDELTRKAKEFRRR